MMRIERVVPVVLLAASAALSGGDTTWHSLSVGYDHGLSFRYWPKAGKLGMGIVVRPMGFGTLYESYDAERREERDDYVQVNSYDGKEKGATGLVDVMYRYPIGKRFHLTPFVSLGGKYATRSSSRSYSFEGDGAPAYDLETRREEVTVRGFIGQIGIMPGISLGPCTIEIRLGIGGMLEYADSPDDIEESTERDVSELFLLYPRDIVQSLVFHIGFR